MNNEFYDRLKNNVENFTETYCKMVPLNQIDYDVYNSQIRASGHVVNMVPRYAESIRTHGINIFPPVSVERMSETRYRLKDGNTRILAAKEAGASEILVSWYHDEVDRPRENDWRRLQIQFNDHPQNSPNTTQDLKNFLKEERQSEQMTTKATGFAYPGRENDYIEAAARYYKNLIPNSGKNLKWWRGAVKESLQGYVSEMLETYTNKDAIEFYKDVTNWQGKKGGDISNNTCVYTCDGSNYVNPAIIGLTLCKSVDNPGVKFVIVVYVKDTVGCSTNDIHKRRLEMKNAIVRYTANQNFDIDIVYLPQIKRGTGKENMRKFATPVEEFFEE